MAIVRPIKLTLTEWQKRMVRDFVKGFGAKDLKAVLISVIDKRQWVMYRQPPPAALQAGAWNLYLTDTQIRTVASRLGSDVKISALNVSPELLRSGAIAFK